MSLCPLNEIVKEACVAAMLSTVQGEATLGSVHERLCKSLQSCMSIFWMTIAKQCINLFNISFYKNGATFE